MKDYKKVAIIIGVVGVVISLMGLVIMFSSESFCLTLGIIVICLALAYGLIVLDLSSIIYLAIGGCMCAFPPMVAGIITICFGVIIAIANVLILRKKLFC